MKKWIPIYGLYTEQCRSIVHMTNGKIQLLLYTTLVLYNAHILFLILHIILWIFGIKVDYFN